MIPKIIHYCWFGGNEKPELVKKCIQSWERFCPDYQIIEWNEQNFDINCCAYVKEAYECKKWAFVSDYARLAVVYQNGGIYLDTDIELLKSPDILLNNNAFFGYEDDKHLNTGIGFGAVKGEVHVKAIIDDYEKVHFKNENGSMDLTPCPERNSKVFTKLGYTLNGDTVNSNGVTFYGKEWLCPINYQTGEKSITDKTVSIHHYSGAWMEPAELKIISIERRLRKIIGKKMAFWVRCRLYNVYHFKMKIFNRCL